MKSIHQIIDNNFTWKKHFKKSTLYQDVLDYFIYLLGDE